MPISLRLTTPYLSIDELPVIELPDFALITGLNGSGKTHLLKAIEEGNINTGIQKEHIKHFNWNNLVPNESKVFDSQVLNKESLGLIEVIKSPNAQRAYSEFQSVAKGIGVSDPSLMDLHDLAKVSSVQELRPFLRDPSTAEVAFAAFSRAVQNGSQRILSHFSQEQRPQVQNISSVLNLPIIALRKEDIAHQVPSWGTTNLFQQSFGRLFVTYRDALLRNTLKEYRQSRGNATASPISAAEFEKRYRSAPWTFVNDSLLSAGLYFEIDHPDLDDYSPYEPRLRKRSNGAEIRFANLSSGEKIIMSFALCLYYSKDPRQPTSYPKLLLFDEIDAPLHPSMCRSLLKVMTETLVRENKIKVIATTHSASTVALAPDDAIFVMKEGKPRLARTTKAAALNELTAGVPTIAVGFDGRRQVIVEGPNDALIYERAYQLLKTRFSSERSLVFIAAGTASSGGIHVDTGCSRVKKIVHDLQTGGNSSTFGLIDWDGENEPSDRIVVLAHKKRDGLENVFLDPLLVAAMAIRENKDCVSQLGLGTDTSYAAFLQIAPERLQDVVRRVEAIVLGIGDTSQRKECAYLGGFDLTIAEDYLTLDDHMLEDKVQNGFPFLRAITRNRRSELAKFVAEHIMADQPNYAPMDLFAAFEEVLGKPTHSE